MDDQPWLNRVRQRLAKHDLAPNYVERVVEELANHLEDLKEQSTSTEADAYSRLGEPEQVAEAAVTAYKRRSFLGRHPAAAFLVFGVSPVALLVALFVVTLCFIGMIEIGVGITKEPPNDLGIVGSAVVNFVGSLLTVVVPSILATILYCQLAKRLGAGRKWILVSSVTLAVFASSPAYWRAGSGDHSWRFSVPWCGFHGGGSWVALTQHLVNLIVPLAIAWWFLRRNHEAPTACPS
jgi:hypothetical protein